jgi:hypothetical protein
MCELGFGLGFLTGAIIGVLIAAVISTILIKRKLAELATNFTGAAKDIAVDQAKDMVAGIVSRGLKWKATNTARTK